MERYKNRDKMQAILCGLGIRLEEAEHWANQLGKFDRLNFFPDCELVSYMKLFFKYCQNPQERRWAEHSYLSCHYLWTAFAEIYNWRKSLSREERWALKG